MSSPRPSLHITINQQIASVRSTLDKQREEHFYLSAQRKGAEKTYHDSALKVGILLDQINTRIKAAYEASSGDEKLQFMHEAYKSEEIKKLEISRNETQLRKELDTLGNIETEISGLQAQHRRLNNEVSHTPSRPVAFSPPPTHTHTHAHTHARAHTHIHTHSRTHTHRT